MLLSREHILCLINELESIKCDLKSWISLVIMPRKCSLCEENLGFKCYWWTL